MGVNSKDLDKFMLHIDTHTHSCSIPSDGEMVEAPNAKCGGVNSRAMTHKLQTRGQLEDFIFTLAHSLISPGTLGCARDCVGFTATMTKVHRKKQLVSGHIYHGPAIPPLGIDSMETQACVQQKI